MQHVYIVGSKGIPATYGGFETFVDKLTAGRRDEEICYHVSRLSDHNGEYEYNHAKCFDVKVPDIGPAKAIIRARKVALMQNTVTNALEYTFLSSTPSLLANLKQPVSSPSTRTT